MIGPGFELDNPGSKSWPIIFHLSLVVLNISAYDKNVIMKALPTLEKPSIFRIPIQKDRIDKNIIGDRKKDLTNSLLPYAFFLCLVK